MFFTPFLTRNKGLPKSNLRSLQHQETAARGTYQHRATAVPCTCHVHRSTFVRHGSSLVFPSFGAGSPLNPNPHPPVLSAAAIQRLAQMFQSIPAAQMQIGIKETRVETQIVRAESTNLAPAPATPSTPSAAESPSSSAVASSSSSSSSSPDPRRSRTQAAVAAIAISHITPQFLVFIRSDSELAKSPISAQSILEYSAKQGLDWTNDGGVSERHIHVVHAPDGTDYTRMAGFPSQTAFYLTFPRHETRSPARIKFIEQMLDQMHTPSSMQVQSWGWKLLRYPNQLHLSALNGRMSTAAFQQLTPRAILIGARASGCPGWDKIEESMIHQHKGGMWARYSKPAVQFYIRVPPHPRYLAAVADIARTSNQLQQKLGWVAEIPRNPNGVHQEVPALPIQQQSKSTATAAGKPSESLSAAPALKPSTPAAPSTVASSPSPRAARGPSPPPSRFYFYFIDETGRLFIEDELTSKAKQGLGLRDRRTLNVLYSQMRVATDAMQQTPLLEHIGFPVPIPPGAVLPQSVTHVAEQRIVPMSLIPKAYPYLSMCAGEVNFFRCAVAPVVFKSLIPDSRAKKLEGDSGPPMMLLQYAGDLTYPFEPRRLAVDGTGRLFHPCPPLGSASSDQSVHLGLIASNLTQELVLHEAPFTHEELDYSIKQQEETRRLTIEVHEDHQRRLYTDPSQFAGVTPDQWIRTRVHLLLAEIGLDIAYSKYVVEWQGMAYRIRSVEA